MSENVVLRVFADGQSTALRNEIVTEAVGGFNFLTDAVLTDQPAPPAAIVVGVFIVNDRFLSKELAFSGIDEIHKTQLQYMAVYRDVTHGASRFD